ncbi:MAG: PilZ domain-containing protein [bacterium]
MKDYSFEKRKHPRVDVSEKIACNIKIYGLTGKPVVGKVINISLGGVAFLSHYRDIAKAVKRPNPKVEILLPDGRSVDAMTTLLRIRPQPESDDCVCVFRLTELNSTNSTRLQKFIIR